MSVSLQHAKRPCCSSCCHVAMLLGCSQSANTALLRQKAVSAHLKSEQIRPFVFSRHADRLKCVDPATLLPPGGGVGCHVTGEWPVGVARAYIADTGLTLGPVNFLFLRDPPFLDSSRTAPLIVLAEHRRTTLIP